MSGLKYWIWLASAKNISALKALSLLNRFGTPENVYFAEEIDYRETEGLNERDIASLGNKKLDRAERILEDCDLIGARAITLQDAEYPDRLKNIYEPPCVLYIKGRMFSYDEEPAVAVVGTRKATPYGLVAAERISYQIAKGGGIIVSGVALGIDSAAHKGALKAGAPTIGVLGCGIDIIYPPVNKYLYEDIAATGALISEYPPKTEANGIHFPARNRIISGISLGTIIVEAPLRSGALITARLALDQGRDVFAVPGNIDVRESEGTNDIIKQGAMLITSGQDVLGEYEPLFPHKINLCSDSKQTEHLQEKKRELTEAKPIGENASGNKDDEIGTEKNGYIDLTEKIKDFTDDERNIIVSIAGKTRHIDEIIDITGMNPGSVLSSLTVLEVKGAVRQLPGKRFEFII